MNKDCERFFPRHSFGKWEVFSIKNGEFVRDLTIIHGDTVYQKRECSECGLVEFQKDTIV